MSGLLNPDDFQREFEVENAEPVVDGVPHLSASSIGSYLLCPRSWWYEKIFGVRGPASSALICGTAMHAAAEVGMREKLETGEDISPEVAQDIARETTVQGYEEQAESVEDTGLRDHLIDDKDSEEAIDRSTSMALIWATQSSPLVMPREVESEYRSVIGGVRIVGRLDVIADSGEIIDWKTSSKKPSRGQADCAIQAELYPVMTGCGGMTFIYHVSNKRTKEAIPQRVSASVIDMAPKRSQATVEHVARAIRAGSFPRNRTGWKCSQKMCPFYARCMSGADDQLVAETSEAIRANQAEKEAPHVSHDTRRVA